MLKLYPERSEDCISDLVFDEWSAGEVPEEQARALEAHVSDCERCAARRQALAAQAAAFLERPRHLAGQNSRARREGRYRVIAYAGAVLAAAAALVLVVRPAPENGVRTKGGPRLGFFVKRGEQVQEGAAGERVRPGDQLRFVVSLTEPKHVAVFSRDARGTASVYYPGAGAARLLQPGAGQALDSSVELDDTLGREQLYGVFCDQPIDLEAVRSELARSGKLVAPGCMHDVVEIAKEKPE